MKNPYPVAFLATVAICAIIIVYHVAFRDEGGPSISLTAAESAARDRALSETFEPTKPAKPTPPTVTFGAPRPAFRDPLGAPAGQPAVSEPTGPGQPGGHGTTLADQSGSDLTRSAQAPGPERISLSASIPAGSTPSASTSPAAMPAGRAETEAGSAATAVPPQPGAATGFAAPGASSSPPSAQSLRTYAIKAGDNFSSISLALYGSDEYWDEIAQANPLVDPTKLKVGQVIYLPTLETLRGPREATPTPATPGRTPVYVVRAGDTLWNIAVQYYENGRLWRHLYNANRGVIGSNPDKLEAGTKLRIPPPPDAAR